MSVEIIKKINHLLNKLGYGSLSEKASFPFGFMMGDPYNIRKIIEYFSDNITEVDLDIVTYLLKRHLYQEETISVVIKFQEQVQGKVDLNWFENKGFSDFVFCKLVSEHTHLINEDWLKAHPHHYNNYNHIINNNT